MKTPTQQIKIYKKICKDLENIILIQEKYISLLDQRMDVLNRMLYGHKIQNFPLDSLKERNGEVEDLNKRYFEMIRAY